MGHWGVAAGLETRIRFVATRSIVKRMRPQSPPPPPAHYYWAAMAPPRQHTSAVGARGAWGHFHSSGAGAAHAAVARPRGHSPFRLCASPPQLARSPAAAAAGADHTLPSPRPDGSQGGRRGAGQGLWRRLPRAATASAPADAGVSRLQPVSLSILTRTVQYGKFKYQVPYHMVRWPGGQMVNRLGVHTSKFRW